MLLNFGTHANIRNGMTYAASSEDPKCSCLVWDTRKGADNKWSYSGMYKNGELDNDPTRFVKLFLPMKMFTQCFLDEMKVDGGTDA